MALRRVSVAAPLLLYPTDRPVWSRLTRLLSLGKGRAGKGGCALGWADVAASADGMIAILLPDEADAATADHLADLARGFCPRAYCGISLCDCGPGHKGKTGHGTTLNPSPWWIARQPAV